MPVQSFRKFFKKLEMILNVYLVCEEYWIIPPYNFIRTDQFR